jgi:hypothetical protein
MEMQKYENLLEEINKDFMDIPFGNSIFQIKHFVLNASETPQRLYRTLGLYMQSKIQSLKDAQYGTEEKIIDLEEAEAKLKFEDNIFEKRRLTPQITKIRDGLESSKKLIKDAMIELDYCYSIYKDMPKFTREEFENAELEYYSKNLHKQAIGLTGAPNASGGYPTIVSSVNEFLFSTGSSTVSSGIDIFTSKR